MEFLPDSEMEPEPVEVSLPSVATLTAVVEDAPLSFATVFTRVAVPFSIFD